MAKNYLLTGDAAIPAEWSKQFMSWAIQAQVPENESGFGKNRHLCFSSFRIIIC